MANMKAPGRRHKSGTRSASKTGARVENRGPGDWRKKVRPLSRLDGSNPVAQHFAERSLRAVPDVFTEILSDAAGVTDTTAARDGYRSDLNASIRWSNTGLSGRPKKPNAKTRTQKAKKRGLSATGRKKVAAETKTNAATRQRARAVAPKKGGAKGAVRAHARRTSSGKTANVKGHTRKPR